MAMMIVKKKTLLLYKNEIPVRKTNALGIEVESFLYHFQNLLEH